MYRVDMSDTQNRTFPSILSQQACYNANGEFPSPTTAGWFR